MGNGSLSASCLKGRERRKTAEQSRQDHFAAGEKGTIFSPPPGILPSFAGSGDALVSLQIA